MTLTVEQLGAIIKQDGEAPASAVARAAVWLPHLLLTMTTCGITSPKRVAAFVAQMALESGGFLRVVENLNYSAQGLANTWPNRYSVKGSKPPKPNDLALRLARNPKAIASNVYANRMGNGDEASGEGWLYRGRGLKMVTGKDNYIRCGKAMGLDLVDHPELLEQPCNAAASAGWFWNANQLWSFADAGDFIGMTKVINGGLIGYDDNDRRDKDTRMDYWVQAKRILGVV